MMQSGIEGTGGILTVLVERLFCFDDKCKFIALDKKLHQLLCSTNLLPQFRLQSLNLDDKMGSKCRACLNITEKSKSLYSEDEYEETLASIMWKCTGVRPLKGDGLPELLCQSCFMNLSIADHFRLLAVQSDEILHRHNLNVKEIASKIISPESELSNDVENLNENLSDDFEYEHDKNVDNSDTDMDTGKCVSEVISIDESSNDNVQCFDDPTDDGENTKKNESNGNRKSKVKCKICKHLLLNKLNLKIHMERFHKKEYGITKEKLSKNKYRFNCPGCSYKSLKYSHMVRHYSALHEDERPFKCDECDKTFTRHSTLMDHKATHRNVTPYSCGKCKKKFKSKNAYYSHRKNTHPEISDYACSLCDKIYLNLQSLKAHEKRH